jgi:hypothetical protein
MATWIWRISGLPELSSISGRYCCSFLSSLEPVREAYMTPIARWTRGSCSLGEQAGLAGVLRLEDRLAGVRRVEQRVLVVGVLAVGVGDAGERLGVAAAGAGDLTHGLVVAAEAEVAHRQVAAVDGGDQGGEARVALGEAARPRVALPVSWPLVATSTPLRTSSSLSCFSKKSRK